MRSTARAAQFLAFLAALLAAAGCTPDFDKEYLVKDLRILAMRAEPPELIVKVPCDPNSEALTCVKLLQKLGSAGTIDLSSLHLESLPTVRVDALAVDPTAPSDLVDWTIHACTPEGKTCDDASQSVLVQTGRSRLDQIQVDFSITPDLLIASLQQDTLRGFGGVPVLLHLVIQRGSSKDQAVSRIVYGLSCPCEKTANKNPTISSILVDRRPLVRIVRATAGLQVKLLPLSGDSNWEHYWVATFDPTTVTDAGVGKRYLREYLSYEFYTTSGSFSAFTTGGKPSSFVARKSVTDFSSFWTPGQDASSATIWIVVRDDRGGVGWTTFAATIQPTPDGGVLYPDMGPEPDAADGG
jgi:hypothetical protein